MLVAKPASHESLSPEMWEIVGKCIAHADDHEGGTSSCYIMVRVWGTLSGLWGIEPVTNRKGFQKTNEAAAEIAKEISADTE